MGLYFNKSVDVVVNLQMNLRNPERRGSNFFPLAGGGTAHGQDAEPLSVWGAGRTDPLDLGELASSLDRESPRPETDLTSAIHGVMGAHKEALENSVRAQLGTRRGVPEPRRLGPIDVSPVGGPGGELARGPGDIIFICF